MQSEPWGVFKEPRDHDKGLSQGSSSGHEKENSSFKKKDLSLVSDAAKLSSKMEMKPLAIEIGKSLTTPEGLLAVEC